MTESLRGRVPTVAIVHSPGSTLTGLADHVIMSAGGPSSVPVMTKTFASTLTAAILLVGELFGDDRADAIAAALERAADAAELAIDEAEPKVGALAAELATAEHVFVVGSGGGHVAALEGALKLKEMALVHAEGSESWEMASGAATLIGPTSTVVALAPSGPGREAVLDVARALPRVGRPRRRDRRGAVDRRRRPPPDRGGRDRGPREPRDPPAARAPRRRARPGSRHRP